MQSLQTFFLLPTNETGYCVAPAEHWTKFIEDKILPEDSMQYMVSVQNYQGHVCGGFLISEEFVVTAAHCDEKEPTFVYLGSHDQREFKDYSYFKKYKPKTYKNVKNGDDIMLLKLDAKVKLSSKVKTIQLPASGANVQPNEKCVVAGWGKTEPGGKSGDELRMEKVSVIDLQTCKEKEPGLPSNVICTDKGFSEGYQGGPLVCSRKAVGVVSFNSFYTDISKHLFWIQDIMKK